MINVEHAVNEISSSSWLRRLERSKDIAVS